MSYLMIAVFRSAETARSAAEVFARMQDTAEVTTEDISVVTRAPEGRVTLDHMTRQATGQPLGGGRWGVTLGLLFLDGDLGQPSAVLNSGIERGFLDDAATALDGGHAAVVTRVRKLGITRSVAAMARCSGYVRVIRTRLDPQAEAALKAVQSGLPAQLTTDPILGGPL